MGKSKRREKIAIDRQKKKQARRAAGYTGKGKGKRSNYSKKREYLDRAGKWGFEFSKGAKPWQ